MALCLLLSPPAPPDAEPGDERGHEQERATMNGLMRGLRGAVLLGAGVAITGCSQLGTLGNVLGGVMQPGAGSGSAQVAGTVRYVDTQRQMLQVTTTNGQTGNVYFDNRTQVVYQQQNYPVTALEQGDEVQMQLQQDQQGNYYTSYIQVVRSVRDSGGGKKKNGGKKTRGGDKKKKTQ